MSTTLLEELEQAAKRAESLARACDSAASDDPRLGGRSAGGPHWAEAARLRARATHIREMLANASAALGAPGLLELFTGPIDMKGQ